MSSNLNKKEKSKVLGIIPARIGSTRVPKKMLADICGKTLIQRTVERTQGATLLDALIVATDSKDIAESVRSTGVQVIMWPLPLPSKNGTEGVALALKEFTDFVPDIVVNIWGDEPLYSAEAIDECIKLLLKDEALQVAGVADFIEDESMLHEPSIVQVLTDLKNNVLCFSRAPVPHSHVKDSLIEMYHIIGVMAMRRDFLHTFLCLPQTPIELREGVEQMRILEHGYRMRVVKGKYRNLGVNTPEELEIVRGIVKARQDK